MAPGGGRYIEVSGESRAVSTLVTVLLIVAIAGAVVVAFDRGIISLDEPSQTGGQGDGGGSNDQPADQKSAVNTPATEIRDSQTPIAKTLAPAKQDIDAPGELDTELLEREIESQVNAERSEQGVPHVTTDPRLEKAARMHSRDMVENGYLSQTAPDGTGLQDRYDEVGYDCRIEVGEDTYASGEGNIARHPATGSEEAIAEAIVESWSNSIVHQEVMLRNYWRFDGVGVAVVQGEDTVWVYATQYFC